MIIYIYIIYVYDVYGFLRFWLADFVFMIGSGRMSDIDIPPCFSAGSHPLAFQSSMFLTPPWLPANTREAKSSLPCGSLLDSFFGSPSCKPRVQRAPNRGCGDDNQKIEMWKKHGIPIETYHIILFHIMLCIVVMLVIVMVMRRMNACCMSLGWLLVVVSSHYGCFYGKWQVLNIFYTCMLILSLVTYNIGILDISEKQAFGIVLRWRFR